MEACIEALYPNDGESDKRKTLEMIRILKGAISVSKSRTGEVIYHYNRHEKKALRKTMAKFDRDTVRSKVHIESQKRDVLRKWNLVFGRQKKFTESMRGFDNMLDEAISSRHLTKPLDDPPPPPPEEEEEKPVEEAKEEEKAEEEEVSKMPPIRDPRMRRLGSHLSHGVVAIPPMVGVLPNLSAVGGSLHNARIENEEEERARKEKEAEKERQRKAKELPRFDKELMEAYLSEQKSLHEDLLTRNALIKIKTSLDKDHVFFKYRLKSKLPDSAPNLLQSIGRERTASAVTWAGSSRSRSRLSLRHHGDRLRSSKSTKSCQSGREEAEELGQRLEKVVVLTDRPSSPAQASQVSDLPRLDRAKTVHFN